MSEVKIPDSLKPENIMETIEKREKIQKSRRNKKIWRTIASVAVGAVVVGVTTPVVVQKLREQKMNSWEWSHVPEALDNYEELYEIRNEVIAYNELRDKLSWDWGWGGKKSDNASGSSGGSLPESSMDAMNGAGDFIYEESVQGEAEGEGSSTEHSETNVQTEGVDESDWVKTDGEYIYYINKFYDELEIIKADGEDSELIGQYKLTDMVKELEVYANLEVKADVNVGEGYLVNDRLVLPVTADTSFRADNYYYDRETGSDDKKGYIICLNVEDKEKVFVEGTYEYEGELLDTRIKDEILYAVTRKNIDYSSKRSVPIEVNGETYPAEDVLLMNIEKGRYYRNYTCVAAMDIMDTMKVVGSEVYATCQNPEMYMSTENIYLYSNMNGAESEIVKISLAEGNVEFRCRGWISGYFNDQFSLDEYKGYLRVVYTDRKAGSNVLEIFDKDMKTVGKIDDIAKGERIYSARFQGDLGYFVTYRETDPLFCVNLEDPTTPRILGYLKIPGYSSYLHPIYEDMMFGIGYEDWMLKISLFDVSDSRNPEEVQVFKFEGCYYAEAASNHKALMVAKDNSVFGFMATREASEDSYNVEVCEYTVMSYQDGALKIVETIELNNYFAESIRAVQSGDYLYLVTGSGCDVYTMDTVLSEENALKIAEVLY